MHEAVRHLCQGRELLHSQIWGVGLGLQGPLGPDTEVLNTHADLPSWDGFPLTDTLIQSIGLLIVTENNANAAAIGERWYGAGEKVSHFLYVFFGLWLGGGVVLDGQPHSGVGGFAGELVYILVDVDLDRVAQGDIKRLGDYFSLANLHEEVKVEGFIASCPADLETLYAQHNAYLTSWLDSAARRLAPVLITIEYIVDPDLIVFGGRLPNSLIDHVLERLNHLLRMLRGQQKDYGPKLLRAQAGEDAAALEVATLPIPKALAPNHQVLLKANGKTSSLDVFRIKR